MNQWLRQNISGLVALLVLAVVVAWVLKWRTAEQVAGDYQVKKGNYRLEDGQYQKALEEFSLALERNPRHPGAHLGMGIAYMQMGRHEEALQAFGKAIEIDPRMAVAYADRGILLDRMGRYEEALRDYERALELEPRLGKGPGWLWRFLRNIPEKPPTIADRARYLRAELAKPPQERLLRVPEKDAEQLMYKFK
jgi:tetratricopeptide (TPR) repeat protein